MVLEENSMSRECFRISEDLILVNLKPRWDITSHMSGWLLKKRIIVGKDVEKLESWTLLAGMQNGVAAIENSMKFLQKN